MCGDGSLPPPPLEANLYELFKAYWRLRNRTTQLQAYAITAEQLSVTDRMRELLDLLHGTAGCWLSDLCVPVSNRQLVVVTFLALLEMIKKRMVQIVQESATNDLWVSEVECD
jgi:segregation and condensation protein A